jgi:hypothetical protein
MKRKNFLFLDHLCNLMMVYPATLLLCIYMCHLLVQAGQASRLDHNLCLADAFHINREGLPRSHATVIAWRGIAANPLYLCYGHACQHVNVDNKLLSTDIAACLERLRRLVAVTSRSLIPNRNSKRGQPGNRRPVSTYCKLHPI